MSELLGLRIAIKKMIKMLKNDIWDINETAGIIETQEEIHRFTTMLKDINKAIKITKEIKKEFVLKS